MAERYDRFAHLCVDEALRKMGVTERPVPVLDAVAALYENTGGSWEALANADPDAWTALKKACKAYVAWKRDQK